MLLLQFPIKDYKPTKSLVQDWLKDAVIKSSEPNHCKQSNPEHLKQEVKQSWAVVLILENTKQDPGQSQSLTIACWSDSFGFATKKQQI